MDYSNPNKIPDKTTEKAVDTKSKIKPQPTNIPGAGIKIGGQTVPSPTALHKEVPVDENAPYDPVAKELRDYQNYTQSTDGVVPDRPLNFSDIQFAQKLMGFNDKSKSNIWNSEKERQGITIPFIDKAQQIPVEAVKKLAPTPSPVITKPPVLTEPVVGSEPQPAPVVEEKKAEAKKGDDFWSMIGNIAAQTGLGIGEILQAGVAGRTAGMQGRALDFAKETSQGQRLAKEAEDALTKAQKDEQQAARAFTAEQGQLDRDAQWKAIMQSNATDAEKLKAMQQFEAQQNALSRANQKDIAMISGAGRVQAAEKGGNWRMQ